MMSDLSMLVKDMTAPTVIVDRQANIIASNSTYKAAIEIYGFEDLPTLYAYGDGETRAFICKAIADTSRTGQLHHATIPMRHSQVRAAVTFAPLEELSGPDERYADLCVGVFHLVEISPVAAMAMMERDYGLSEHEMYFAAHLMSGHSLRESANHMDMSHAQADRELKIIFAKTGASSLDELSTLLDEVAIAS